MGKQPYGRELLLALIAVVVISLAYIFMQIALQETPAASSFYGHSLGILGFVLMLMTETLYSLRKRSRSARLGAMSRWLEFHIFTGLVGPFLVLLHSSWKFNGLAGLLMLFTLIIVASGFIGRYLYTAIPRSAGGMELSLGQIQRQMESIEGELEKVRASQVTLPNLKPVGQGGQNPTQMVLARAWYDWQERQYLRRAQRQVRLEAQPLFRDLAVLEREKRQLQRQMSSLAAARRLLALWHAVHIPIGLALFSMAFIHIAADVYFALLK